MEHDEVMESVRVHVHTSSPRVTPPSDQVTPVSPGIHNIWHIEEKSESFKYHKAVKKATALNHLWLTHQNLNRLN